MAQTALAATQLQTIGSFLQVAIGVAGGSGTTTVVTVPQFTSIKFVLPGGATSATAPFCDTISGNTFTVTHGNNDLFAWMAYGSAKL